jgi:predicted PurR-regulated permease PerM
MASTAAPPRSTRTPKKSTVSVLEPLGPVALRWAVLVLAVGATLALWPFWAPLVLAAWFAHIARPLQARFGRWMHKRERGAGVATVLLVIVGLAPLAVISLSLAAEASDIIERFSKSQNARETFGALLSGNSNGGTPQSPTQLDLSTAIELGRQHGMSAISTASRVAGATTRGVVGMVIFVYGFYVFLVHGRSIYEWLRDHSPLEQRHFERLAGAFTQTGRGLLIGFGLTAMIQGVVAAIGYLILGIPHALVLGLLTAIAALIPAVGTGLVWVPLAAGLAIFGHWGQAIGVLAIGSVVSLGDNFLRPALSRYGKLDLPMFLLFVAMLGGFAAFGGWGLLLGPVLVRLSIEGLEILREKRAEPSAAGR